MHPVHLALSKSIRFWVLVACAMKWMMYVYVHYTDSDCQKECLFFAYLLWEEYPPRVAYCIPVLIDAGNAYDVSKRATPEISKAGRWCKQFNSVTQAGSFRESLLKGKAALLPLPRSHTHTQTYEWQNLHIWMCAENFEWANVKDNDSTTQHQQQHQKQQQQQQEQLQRQQQEEEQEQEEKHKRENKNEKKRKKKKKKKKKKKRRRRRRRKRRRRKKRRRSTNTRTRKEKKKKKKKKKENKEKKKRKKNTNRRTRTRRVQ